jgi:hypothetical protein
MKEQKGLFEASAGEKSAQGGNMNRYVIEYELSSGTKGIMIFSAVNIVEAEQYVRDLLQKYKYKAVSTLHQITTIDDLYRLYPPLQQKEGQVIPQS